MDTVVLPDRRRQCRPAPAPCAGLQPRQLHAVAGDAEVAEAWSLTGLREKLVAARKQQFDNHGWPRCDDPALATVFFNLGYAIDIRDVRRGDLIGIDWANGHGHAAFVWDVHTDEDNAVDCLQFLSAKGYAANGVYRGPGVSVSAPNEAASFIDHPR
jgi:hypothetical protein